MMIRSFALAAGQGRMLRVNRSRTFVLAAALVGTGFCVLAPEARAQSDEFFKNVTIDGGLTVNSTTTLKGALDMRDGEIANVGSLDAIAITARVIGNINEKMSIVSGTLTVGSDPDKNILDVKATSTFEGPVTVNGTTLLKGNTTLGTGSADSLTVNASSTFNAPVTVNSKLTTSSLEVTNDAVVKGNLTVEGDAEFKGKLSFSGNTDLKGGASIANYLTVAPGTTVSMGGNRVQDVAAPIFDTDAANKGYVDAGLAKAFKEIDRNTQGIAIAMAMSGLALPAEKSFALGANIGFFEDKQALAVQGAIRINPYLTFNGGFGTGLQDANTVGGRIGVQAAW